MKELQQLNVDEWNTIMGVLLDNANHHIGFQLNRVTGSQDVRKINTAITHLVGKFFKVGEDVTVNKHGYAYLTSSITLDN